MARQKVADGVCRLQRSEDEQGVINDEVPCFATENSTENDAAPPANREVVTGFSRNTETEARTEHSIFSKVLSVEG